MQVFKMFFKIQKKYMIPAIIFFAMGILMIVVNYEFLIKNSTSSMKDFQTMKMPIHLTDEDHSTVSDYFVDYLKKYHNLDDKTYTKDVLTDRLYYEDIASIITIPAGFGEAFLSGETGECPQIQSVVDEGIAHGQMLNLELQSYLSSMYAFYHSGMELSEAAAKAEETQRSENYVTIVDEIKEDGTTQSHNTQSVGGILFLFIPYVIMSCVFGSLLSAVLSFNETEKKKRENASGYATWKRSLTLAFGSLVFALFFFLMYVVVLAIFCGSEAFTKMWFLMVLNLLVYTIATVMMMAFIAVIPLKASVLSSIVSTVVSLGFAFLGGIFVPLSQLGEGVKAIGRFLPTYWYATAVDALDKGKGFTDVLPYYGIQLLFGAACLAIGMALSKASERAH